MQRKPKFSRTMPKKMTSFLSKGDIVMNNVSLDIVNNYTYLGIKIDSELTFNGHAKHLASTTMNILYSLSVIRKYINTKTAIIIGKAFILSRLEYGAVFCMGSNCNLIDKLQKLLNKMLRICYKASYTHSTNDLHVQAKLLPLKIRRKIHLINLMFHVNKRNRMLHYTNDTRTTGQRVTRQGSLNKFVPCPFPRTEWFRKSVAYQGPKHWGILPVRFKNIEDSVNFKKAIKDHYISEFIEDGYV